MGPFSINGLDQLEAIKTRNLTIKALQHQSVLVQASYLPGNKPIIVYTGIDPQQHQVQNIAVPANMSDLFLTEWTKLNCNQLVVLAKVWMRLLFLTRQRPSGVKMRIGGSWWVVKGSTGRWLFCIGGRILWSGSRCNILYILQLMQECGSALIFFLSRLWAKTGWILHSHAHVWSMCWRWALTFRDMSTIL